MTVHITCPDCEARLKLAQPPAPGALLICPKCSKSIRVAQAELDEDDGANEDSKTNPQPSNDERGQPRASTKLTEKPQKSGPPRRPIREEPDDDEPVDRSDSKRSRGKRDGTPVVVWVILGIVVVVAIGGLTAYAVVQLTFTTPPQQTIVMPTFGRMPGAPDARPSSEVEENQRQMRAFEEQRKRNEQRVKEADVEAEKFTPPPRPARSLDWAGLNVTDVSIGSLATRPAADLEALRYLPTQTDMVIGLDTAALGSKLVLTFLMQKLAALGDASPIDQLQRETGCAVKDLDQIVIAGRVNYSHESWVASKPFPVEVTTYAVKTKVPFGRDTILQVVKAGSAKQVDGKNFYPVPGVRGDKPVHVYFPTDSIIVVCTLPVEQLDEVARLGGKLQSLRIEMLDALGGLDQCHAFVVAPPTTFVPHLPADSPLAVSLKPVVEAVSRSKVVGLSLRFQDDLLKLGIDLAFSNDAEAKKSADAIDGYWGKSSRDAIGDASAKIRPGYHGVIGEIAREAHWQQRGPCVAATAPVHFKSIDEMLKAFE